MSVVKKFASETAVSGIPQIVGARATHVRVFWVAAFTICLGFAVYQMVQLGMGIAAMPSETSFSVKDTKELHLPDIAVCPATRFHAGKVAADSNISELVARVLQLGYTFPTSAGYSPPSELMKGRDLNVSEQDAIALLLASGDEPINETVTKLGFGCNEVILDCINEGRSFNCCANATLIDTVWGQCHRISGLKQTLKGPEHGILIRSKMKPKDRFHGDTIMFTQGITVKLIENNQLEFDFLAVDAMKLTHMALERRVTEMDHRAAKCIASVTAADYGQCIEECLYGLLSNGALKERGCRTLGNSLQSQATERYCTPFELVDIFETSWMKDLGTIEDQRQLLLHCRDGCKKPCTQVSFAKTVTVLSLEPDSFEEDSPLLPIDQGTAMVNVYYKSLKTTHVKQTLKYSTLDIIGLFGGTLALWTGVSITGLIHAVAFWMTAWLRRD